MAAARGTLGLETNKSTEAPRHSIYRVPASIKDLNRKVYHPQVVSLGPFHHGEPHLKAMEEHKLRAWQQVLARSGRPASDFTAAVDGVAAQLESAYMGLGEEWRAGEGRDKFVHMMTVDGCFVLEVVRVATWGGVDGYSSEDPIFGLHRRHHNMLLFRRDMLMLENQLPLLLLKTLLAVESGGNPPNDPDINIVILRFVSPIGGRPGDELWLHSLDAVRRTMVSGPQTRTRDDFMGGLDADGGATRSAVELYERGVRFKTTSRSWLKLNSFNFRPRTGELCMPTLPVDDTTEYVFLNIMAFERLHVDAGSDVTDYVVFMSSLIHSAEDVALLASKGVIENSVGSHQDVANLFRGLARDVIPGRFGTLDSMARLLNQYSRLPWEMWFAQFKNTYLSSPWAVLSLAAGSFLLLLTVLQTVYTMMQFYRDA